MKTDCTVDCLRRLDGRWVNANAISNEQLVEVFDVEAIGVAEENVGGNFLVGIYPSIAVEAFS